jgi:hypothetical protein
MFLYSHFLACFYIHIYFNVPDFLFMWDVIYCARECLRCVALTVEALINAVPWDVLPQGMIQVIDILDQHAACIIT